MLAMFESFHKIIEHLVMDLGKFGEVSNFRCDVLCGEDTSKASSSQNIGVRPARRIQVGTLEVNHLEYLSIYSKFRPRNKGPGDLFVAISVF